LHVDFLVENGHVLGILACFWGTLTVVSRLRGWYCVKRWGRNMVLHIDLPRKTLYNEYDPAAGFPGGAVSSNRKAIL
jgi:hypothetical protein